MIYKIVTKGFCVDFTANKRHADDTFRDCGRDTQMFVVYADGSAKLIQTK